MSSEAIEIRVDQTQLTRAFADSPIEGETKYQVAEAVARVLNMDATVSMSRIPHPPYTVFNDPSWPRNACILPEVSEKLVVEFNEKYPDWEVAVLFEEDRIEDPSLIVKDFSDRPGIYLVKTAHGLDIPENLEELVLHYLDNLPFNF